MICRAPARNARGFSERDVRDRKGNLRILLAEDDPINQRVTLLMLDHLGYMAKAVANGREALQEMENQKYDLVLMDIKMPEMDGLEAARLIRRLWPRDGPGIIAVTAYALKGDKEMCLDAGMDGYLAKPFTLDELRIAIDSCFMLGNDVKVPSKDGQIAGLTSQQISIRSK